MRKIFFEKKRVQISKKKRLFERWLTLLPDLDQVPKRHGSNLNIISVIFRLKSKEFLDIQETRECRFTLKRVRDLTRTYSQMHRTDKFSELSSIIWPVWPNG